MTIRQQQSKRKHEQSKLRLILHRHKQQRQGSVGATDPPQNPPGTVAAPAASVPQPARDTDGDSFVLRADSRGEGVDDEFTLMDEEVPPVVVEKKPSSAITQAKQLQSPNPHPEDDAPTSNSSNDAESNRAHSERQQHSTTSNMQKAYAEGSPPSDENATNGKRKSSKKSGKTKQPDAVKVTRKNSMRTQTAAGSSLTSSLIEWTCPKCTLCNPVHKRRCQVCQERRPTDVSLGGLQSSSQESITTASDAAEPPAVDILINQPKGDKQTAQPNSAVPAANQSRGGSNRTARLMEPNRKVDGVAKNQKSGGSTPPLVVTIKKNQTQNESATKRTVPENAALLVPSTAHVSRASTRSQSLDGNNQPQIDDSHQPLDAHLYATTPLQEQHQQQQHLMFLQLQNEQNELLEQQELLCHSESRLRQEQQRLWQSMEINRNLLRRNQQFLAFFQMPGQQLGHCYSRASPRPLPETLQASTCPAVSAKEPPNLLQQTPASHGTATTAASSPMTSGSRSTGKAFRSDTSPASRDNDESGIELEEEASNDDATPPSFSKTDFRVTEERRLLDFGEPPRALSPLSAPRPHATTDVLSPANSTHTMDDGRGDESSRPNSNDQKAMVGFDTMEAAEVCDVLEATQTSTQTMDFSISHPLPTEKRDGPPIHRHKHHVASPTNLTDTKDYFEFDKPEGNVPSKESGRKIDQMDSRPNLKHASSARATQEIFSAPQRPVLPEATDNRNTKPKSSSGGAWQSNRPSRDFVNQLERRATQSFTAAPSSSTTVASSTWKTALCKSFSMSTKSSIPSRYSRRRDDLWDESQDASQLDDEPGYAYKETVRCKAARQGLQCYDCPECRRFYEVLRKTGHDLPNDFEKTTEMFGRHRARYVPSETPVDFWELDFVDELGAPKEKIRKADGSDEEDGNPYGKKPKSYTS